MYVFAITNVDSASLPWSFFVDVGVPGDVKAIDATRIVAAATAKLSVEIKIRVKNGNNHFLVTFLPLLALANNINVFNVGFWKPSLSLVVQFTTPPIAVQR